MRAGSSLEPSETLKSPGRPVISGSSVMFFPCGPPESRLYWLLTYVGAVPAAAAPPDEDVSFDTGPWALAPGLLLELSMFLLFANSPPFCADSAAREPETLPAPSCVTGALSPRVT